MTPRRPDIRLYDTLSRRIEPFKPLERGKVGMYHCGPTVYDRAHIGNLRSYIFADILRRTFEHLGYGVKQILNITDVGHLSSDADLGEDKMTKALRREGKPVSLEAMTEIGERYFKEFLDDLDSLNVERAHEYPKASGHVPEDIGLIAKLEEKDAVYRTGDGLYFDTSRFPGYGRLGGVDKSSLKDGARVAVDPEKKDPRDFAVWKFDDKLGWDSPWGKGFPGWHIECSAMSRKYLGQPFDIHTGGIDHIPVHHNNEMAQSEAAYGTPLANLWMHNEFVTLSDAKMAKSEGTGLTLSDLKAEGILPLAYRYWLLTAHYRTPVRFTYKAVQAAQNALIRLKTAVRELRGGGAVDKGYTARFEALVAEDLDTPGAIALAWELIKDASVDSADKRATLLDFDQVLGLGLGEASEIAAIPPDISRLIEEREEARTAKDWEQADVLRKKIEAAGFTIRDSAEGTAVERRR